MGALQGGPEGGSFTVDPEGYVREGSGNGQLSAMGPHWKPGRGLIYRGL